MVLRHSICKGYGVQNKQRDMASYKHSITQDTLLPVYMVSVRVWTVASNRKNWVHHAYTSIAFIRTCYLGLPIPMFVAFCCLPCYLPDFYTAYLGT